MSVYHWQLLLCFSDDESAVRYWRNPLGSRRMDRGKDLTEPAPVTWIVVGK